MTMMMMMTMTVMVTMTTTTTTTNVTEDALDTAEAISEIITVDGGKAPPGWRLDRFLISPRKYRIVAATPWSKQPPFVQPETWVASGRPAMAEFTRKWSAMFKTMSRCTSIMTLSDIMQQTRNLTRFRTALDTPPLRSAACSRMVSTPRRIGVADTGRWRSAELGASGPPAVR